MLTTPDSDKRRAIESWEFMKKEESSKIRSTNTFSSSCHRPDLHPAYCKKDTIPNTTLLTTGFEVKVGGGGGVCEGRKDHEG